MDQPRQGRQIGCELDQPFGNQVAHEADRCGLRRIFSGRLIVKQRERARVCPLSNLGRSAVAAESSNHEQLELLESPSVRRRPAGDGRQRDPPIL